MRVLQPHLQFLNCSPKISDSKMISMSHLKHHPKVPSFLYESEWCGQPRPSLPCHRHSDLGGRTVPWSLKEIFSQSGYELPTFMAPNSQQGHLLDFAPVPVPMDPCHCSLTQDSPQPSSLILREREQPSLWLLCYPTHKTTRQAIHVIPKWGLPMC